jgi:hypothetical protein
MIAMVDRFARFGLPLHLTENSLVAGRIMPRHIRDLNDYQPSSWPATPDGEERQANEMVRHYRSLMAHPAVASVTYWGISDNDAWLGAPIGLLRSDGSPRPAYDALHRLIKGEWWVGPTTTRTDEEGKIALTGFLGDYEVAVAGVQPVQITLPTPGACDITVQVGG